MQQLHYPKEQWCLVFCEVCDNLQWTCMQLCAVKAFCKWLAKRLRVFHMPFAQTSCLLSRAAACVKDMCVVTDSSYDAGHSRRLHCVTGVTGDGLFVSVFWGWLCVQDDVLVPVCGACLSIYRLVYKHTSVDIHLGISGDKKVQCSDPHATCMCS